MTTRTNLMNPNRIRSDIRAMLEYHILEALPLKAACEKAGLPYNKNVSQHKGTLVGQAYIKQLKRRRRVIEEFGVDVPALVGLIELRDKALNAASHVAAVRAQELCMKAAVNAKGDRLKAGTKHGKTDMSKDEIINRLSKIQMKATGESLAMPEDSVDSEFWESMKLTK
jgi:hypothetical protein